MSLMAIELQAGIRRANPPVFCLRDPRNRPGVRGVGLRLHNGRMDGRVVVWRWVEYHPPVVQVGRAVECGPPRRTPFVQERFFDIDFRRAAIIMGGPDGKPYTLHGHLYGMQTPTPAPWWPQERGTR